MTHPLSPLELWALIAIFAVVLMILWLTCQLVIPRLLFWTGKRLLMRKIRLRMSSLRRALDEIGDRE